MALFLICRFVTLSGTVDPEVGKLSTTGTDFHFCRVVMPKACYTTSCGKAHLCRAGHMAQPCCTAQWIIVDKRKLMIFNEKNVYCRRFKVEFRATGNTTFFFCPCALLITSPENKFCIAVYKV